MNLRIDLALAKAKTEGRNVMKKDIAARLWPKSSTAAQRCNMSALCTGDTRRIDPEWVIIICQMLGCSSDYLFGLSNE